MSHTPTPWAARRFHAKWMIHHESAHVDGGYFATIEPLNHKTPEGAAAAEANADLIVKAVNAHAELVHAITEAQWLIEQLAPGMRHLAFQDYQRLNTAMIDVSAAAAKVKG